MLFVKLIFIFQFTRKEKGLISSRSGARRMCIKYFNGRFLPAHKSESVAFHSPKFTLVMILTFSLIYELVSIRCVVPLILPFKFKLIDICQCIQ